METDEIVKITLVIIVLVTLSVGATILFGKGDSLLDALKNMLQFGK